MRTFLILLTLNIFAATDGFYHVFVDGTFDLAHFGHQNVIQNAIKTASDHFQVDPDKIRVIAGVSGTDEIIANYKRPSVYTIEEKMRQVNGFKGVYKVLNTEMVTTKEFIEKENIDLVVAGSDYNDPVKRNKYYRIPFEMGIFKTFGRTEGISTSELMKRTATRVALVMEKNAQSEEEIRCIQHFKELMNTRFN